MWSCVFFSSVGGSRGSMYTLTALPVMFFFVVLLLCLPSASTTSTRPPRSCHLAVAGIRLALPIQSSSLPAMALWRLLTRPVWWHCPGTQCLGPKCPCAGSLASPQGPDRGGGFLHAHVLCLKPRTRVPRLPRSPAPVVSGWPVLLL